MIIRFSSHFLNPLPYSFFFFPHHSSVFPLTVFPPFLLINVNLYFAFCSFATETSSIILRPSFSFPVCSTERKFILSIVSNYIFDKKKSVSSEFLVVGILVENVLPGRAVFDLKRNHSVSCVSSYTQVCSVLIHMVMIEKIKSHQAASV